MAFGASEAARWQAYQTRARMGAHLWFQIFTWVLLGWIGLTIYVVWYETGAYWPALQHAYFWRWVICGIISGTPLLDFFAPRLYVPAAGHWYPLPPFTDWLNGPQLYHLPFTIWFFHYGVRTALLPLALAAGTLTWRSRHVIDREHLRGLRLLAPKQHNRQLNGGWVARLVRRPSGIELGESMIAAKKECEHFLITGSPGAGKSTLIRHMLSQIERRGQSAVVIDPDCEFVREFYNESRGDVVLNPLDGRCPFWSRWLEFREDSFTMDSEAMASSLIRGQARTPTEEFFRESSRTLIEAIFQVAEGRSHSGGITDFLAMPRKDIQQALAGTRAFPLIDAGAPSRAPASWRPLPTRSNPCTICRKSVRPAASGAPAAGPRRVGGWVFLSSTEDARAAIQRLQGVWLDSLVRWLMSAAIGSDQVWIMADELPAMEYRPQIEKLITRGRKRGLALVIGFQNVSQLRSIYGLDGAITLTSSPTTKVILRCDEAETAKWASELLGSREVERMTMTQLAGLSTYREGVNLQPHRRTEHIVTAAEIQLLKPFNGYLCVAGSDRTTIRIPERHLEKRQPAFLPRTNMMVPLPTPQQGAPPLPSYQLC
jgi:hypothetical protein